MGNVQVKSKDTTTTLYSVMGDDSLTLLLRIDTKDYTVNITANNIVLIHWSTVDTRTYLNTMSALRLVLNELGFVTTEDTDGDWTTTHTDGTSFKMGFVKQLDQTMEVNGLLTKVDGRLFYIALPTKK